MPLDRNITYRARIDDSDFQAKLTQMRASLDSTFSGAGMAAGSMGFGSANTMAYMNSFQQPGGGGGQFGGALNAGYSVAPMTYSPIPTMFTPSMGQVQMQQTLMGAIGGSFTGSPMFGSPPAGMALNEYMTYSQRQLSDSVGRGVATAAMATAQAGVSTVGSAAGSLIGTALGGPIGGFIGSIGGAMVADTVGRPFAESMADNFRIQDFLSNTSFRYMTGAGSDPYTGRGFSRQDRERAAEGLMKIQRDDFRINMGDVENILQKGTNLGLFEGSTDVDDFQKKFKGLVDNVKRLTSVLHESAGQAMETIKAFKDMGITDPSAINQMVYASDALGIASGKTGAEMVAIGQAGASIFQGTGMNMRFGFEMNQMNTALISQARNQGLISMQDIAQMGGVEAFAQTQTASTAGFLQSGFGRTMLLAGFNAREGRINPSGVAGDVLSMGAQAAGNIGSVQDVFHFQAQQTNMVNQLSSGDLQGMQMQGAFAMATTLMRAGARPDDALRLGADAAGFKTEAQKNMLEAFVHNPEKLTEQMKDSAAFTAQKEVMEDFRDKSAFLYMRNAASNYMMGHFVDPVSNQFARLSTNVAEATNGFLARHVLGADVFTSNASADSSILGDYTSRPRTSGTLTTIDTRGAIFGNRIQRTGSDAMADEILGSAKLDRRAMGAGGQQIDYGYMSATAFSDYDAAKSAAIDLGKKTHHDVSVIRRNFGGQEVDLVVDNDAIADANKKSQHMAVSESALHKAQQAITSGEIGKVRQMTKELQGAKSPEEVIDMLNTHKVLDHAINRDNPTEDDRAAVLALLNTTGGGGIDNVKQQLSGKKGILDASVRAASSEEIASAKKKYMGALSNVLGDKLMGNREAVGSVSDFLGGQHAGDEGELRKHLAASGVDSSEADNIVKKIQNNDIGMVNKMMGRDIHGLATSWITASKDDRARYIESHMKDDGIADKAKASGKSVEAFLSQMYESSSGTRAGVADTGTGVAKSQDFDQIAKSTASTMQLIVTLTNQVENLNRAFTAKGATL